MQLVARSIDDIYLINDPQITLFKTVYRRYSNFSIDNKNLKFNKNVSFDSKGVCNLKKYGDLLHKLYLVINLPEIDMIYQSLTYQDVYNILLTAGIIWNYDGNPTDKVKISDLPNIYETIINAMNDYEQNITLIQINNLIPLNELYNYYSNNTIDDQSGITFLQNYIGGIDLSFNGIIYNKINDEPIDPTVTKSIVSEYNFTESYKKDNLNINIGNLNIIQNDAYNIFLDYVLDYDFNTEYNGDMSNVTLNTITFSNIMRNNVNVDYNNLYDEYFKNCYIKTGLEISYVHTDTSDTTIKSYDNTSHQITTFNNFKYLPNTSNEICKIINTPETDISGIISDTKLVISITGSFMYYDIFNFYKDWLCIVYSGNMLDYYTWGGTNNPISTIILNSDNYNYNSTGPASDNNYINMISDLTIPPNNMQQYVYFDKNYQKYNVIGKDVSNGYDLIYLDSSFNIIDNYNNNYIGNFYTDTRYSTYVILRDTSNFTRPFPTYNNQFNEFNVNYIRLKQDIYMTPFIDYNLDDISNNIIASNIIQIYSSNILIPKYFINNDLTNPEPYNDYYNKVFITIDKNISNVSQPILLYNDSNAYIYDASSISIFKDPVTNNVIDLSNTLLLDNSSNSYVQFIDMSNNVNYKLIDDPIIKGNITNVVYTNQISYTDTNNTITNYENMYLFYNNEMHQILSSNISNNKVTLNIKDIFNQVANIDTFNIIKMIDYYIDVSSATTNTIQFINSFSQIDISNGSGYYIYYDQQINEITSIDIINYIITVSGNLTNIPSYGDICYIFNSNSYITKNNINDTNVVRNTKITIDNNPNNYENIIINNKIYNISNIDTYNNITISTNDYININNNYNLIKTLYNSGSLVDVCGTRILYSRSYDDLHLGTSIEINNDIDNGHGWIFYFNNQNFTINQHITNLFNNPTNNYVFQIILNKNMINVPKNNEGLESNTIVANVITNVFNNKIGINKNNLIIRLNDNTNIDYTNYFIIINNQKTTILYYDTTYKLCILSDKLIFMNVDMINASCILFQNYNIIENNSISDAKIINNKCIVYLGNNASKNNEYYDNWYIEIINSQNKVSEIHKITSYNGTTKAAILDTYFINGIPANKSVYNLFKTIDNPIVTTNIKISNNIFSLNLDSSDTTDYTNSSISINNEYLLIKYYNSNYRLCILEKEFYQTVTPDTLYIIIKSLPEQRIFRQYGYNTPYNNAVQLQKYSLLSTDNLYINNYIKIGNEMHIIINYEGTSHNFMIDSSGWLNIDDISNNYSIYDISFNNNGIIINYDTSNNITTISGDLANNNYIYANNQIYDISNYTISWPYYNVIIDWIKTPQINDECSLFILNNPIVNGTIIKPYPTGVICNDNNIEIIDKYYDNWFINITDISNNITNSQIQRYYGDTTYAVISKDVTKNIQPMQFNSVVPNVTPYKLFSRILDNYEIDKITQIDISNNLITLQSQSSKISNYYKDWYIDISNTNLQIISYNNDTYSATVSGLSDSQLNNKSYIYHLKNTFLEDNMKLYNTINLGISDITQYDINLQIKEVFDNIIPQYYFNYDMYYAYLQYFIDNNYKDSTYVNINYMSIKMNLLLYIYNTLNSNIRQLYAILNTLYYTKYQDPHYMFLFYFYSTSDVIFKNASITNNYNDNFTNNFTIVNPYYYANYIKSSVTNFHYINNSYFNDSTYTKYFQDSQIWKYSGITILSSDISGLYLLDNLPLIIGTDICNLIKSRLLYYNIDAIFTNNLYSYLINSNNDILNILEKNLSLTDGDINYIKSNITNTYNENILLGLFKQYNTYFINEDITLLNISNKQLSALEYVCYKLLYDAINYTSLHYTNININTVYIYLTNAIECFLTPKTSIPTYETFKINNFKFQSSDPSNLSYMISSIWNNIFNLLLDSYNNFYQSILNIDYYTNNLGLYTRYVLIHSYEIMSIDFNNTIDFYNFNTSKINKALNMITNELNKLTSLYNNYNTYNNILYIKNLIITPYSLYYDTFNNIYFALQNTISKYITDNYTFYAEYTYILNETKYILGQYIKCPMDIIGDINNIIDSSNNYINTFNYGFNSVTNPFDQNNEPNLYYWYNTYKTDASYNEFINIMTIITSEYLYNDQKNIDAFYNNFKTNNNVIQYIADTIAKKTDIRNLFNYVKNNWKYTYDNLLQYFNKQINTYNSNLIKIGYNKDPPTMYAEIENAVTNQSPYFAWIKYLGYYMIDNCSITIGGCEIDKHTGEYMIINNAINYDSNKNNGLKHMIGHIPELYTYDSNKKKSCNLYIPLNFWFCTDSGHALPLVAMNYTEIDLNLSLKKLEDVAYWSSLSIFKKKPILKTSIIAEYIYLDENERNIISKSKHEHLIENIQYMNYTYSYRDIKNNSIDPYIYFNNMCKELIWSVQPDNNYINYNNICGFEPKWYEYGFNIGTTNTHIKGIYKWDISNNNTYFDTYNNPSPWKSNDGTLIDISGTILPLQYIINSNNYNIPHNNLYYDSSGNLYDDTNSLVLYNHIRDSSNNIYILDGYLCDSSINYINPSQNITINMNGNHREETKDFMYYNFVQSNTRHKTSLPNGIYSYSFAIYPKVFQPSGALNLSKIENVNLVIELNQNLIQAMKNNKTKIKCVFYVKTYNVLRIMSGMAGLAFFG